MVRKRKGRACKYTGHVPSVPDGWLRSKRLNEGLTQPEFASRYGISVATVSKVERQINPMTPELYAIIELGVPL